MVRVQKRDLTYYCFRTRFFHFVTGNSSAPFLFKSKIDRVLSESVRNEVEDLKLNRKLREIKKLLIIHFQICLIHTYVLLLIKRK